MEVAAVAFVIGFFVALPPITGALARRKGYQFLPWFFAGVMPVISVLVLCFLPFANDPKVSEPEQLERSERGNRIGRNLAIACLALVLLRVMASG
jgi:hypothetical protein